MNRITKWLLLLVVAIAACRNDFDPASKVTSVRILASRADKPYAKPGDTVQLDLLATDGRKDRSRPLALFWIPAPCVNPPGGLYYACYPAFEGVFARGVDLTPTLVSGARLSLPIPIDVLGQTGSTQSGIPFGNLFAFSMACAGHVEYVGLRGSSPAAVPFACFDASGAEVGEDAFVFAYTRVFVFADRTNANPLLDAVTLNGQPVDPAVGITVDHCPTPSGNLDDPTCPVSKLDVLLPPSSQEPDPSNVDVNGNVGGEGLWVDYYVSGGKMKNDVQVLFDPFAGRVSSPDDFEAAPAAVEGALWAVVHDTRGGVSWLEIPVHRR